MHNQIARGVSALYQIIPDEMQNEIIQIGEDISGRKWRIGDITNSIKGYVKDHALCGVMDVYAFISQLLRDEVSSRTVEYYAGLSAFYDPGVRQEYQPLSHSHFSYARQHGDDWISILNLAMDLLEKNGKVPSVAYLDTVYRGGGVEQDIDLQSALNSNSDDDPDRISITLSHMMLSAVEIIQNIVDKLGKIGRRKQADQLSRILDELRDSIDNLL